MVSLRRPSFNREARVQALWQQASAPLKRRWARCSIVTGCRLQTPLWPFETLNCPSVDRYGGHGAERRSRSRAGLTAQFPKQNYCTEKETETVTLPLLYVTAEPLLCLIALSRHWIPQTVVDNSDIWQQHWKHWNESVIFMCLSCRSRWPPSVTGTKPQRPGLGNC